MKVKIRKIDADGARADLAVADVAVPYCGFLYTMWKDIQIDLNHKAHYSTYGFYDVMTYLKILYGVSNNVKQRQMMNSLWARDVASGQSMVTNDVAINAGQYYRIVRASRSKTMELSGKLMVDCLDIARPLPDNVSINLRFYPNEAKKCVLSNNALNTVVEIQDFYLMVPRIFPKSSLIATPTKIPWVKTTVHRFMFNAGSENFGPRSVVHADSLPRHALVTIMSETQLNGARNTCRHEFEHHDVDQMLITVNGEHYPYIKGFQPDFSQNSAYSLLYDSLFKDLGDESSIDVSREDFRGGFVVYPIDLTQKNLSNNYYPPKRTGQVEIQIHFANAPTENLAILVILEEERVLSFDKKREFTDNPAPK